MIIGNPFFKRASERATDDGEFLDLFAPGALDKVYESENRIWECPVILESTPGGGKTTLLRLFSPGPLRMLSQAYGEHRNEIRERLISLGALDQNGMPQILGIYLSCATGYETLHFTEVSSGAFLYLLDLRILMQALNDAVALAGGRFPKDLSRLHIDLAEFSDNSCESLACLIRGDGNVVYRNLADKEDEFLSFINTRDLSSLQMHKKLCSLEILSKISFSYSGEVKNWRPLILLDEVHALSADFWLVIRNLISSRIAKIPVWFGIRSQIFNLDELFSGPTWDGTGDRDYKHIHLDRDNRERRLKQFTNFIKEILDRRVYSAPLEVRSKGINFVNFLCNELDISKQDTSKLYDLLREQIRDEISSSNRFHSLIKDIEDIQNPTYENLIYLCQLLIWIEREKNKPQLDLFGDVDQEGLKAFLLKSDVKTSAELFISTKGKIPYYFGEEKFISLSSGNVEQILRIAGRLFDRVISNARLRRGDVLSPVDQDSIIRAAAKEYWNELSRSLYKGNKIKAFLEIIGKFCYEQTYRLSAPYAPGVTGIALSISDYEYITKADTQKLPGMSNLVEILKDCVAFNLFEINREPISCKGKDWRVLYLNRLLCVYFDLPLSYGGFREQKLKTLITWAEGSATLPKRQEKLF